MDIILFVLSLICLVFGLVLLVDFVIWRVKGRIVRATIIGFQERKNKGFHLPRVSFQVEQGDEMESDVQRIDQFLFLLNRPVKDDFITVIYQVDNPEKSRIYGYISIVAGCFLFVPFLVAFGIKFQSALIFGQVSFALVFGVIVFGGWVLLKLIQKYY